MYLGFIVEQGAGDDVFERPLHPYTAALLEAAPSIGKTGICAPLAGDVPSPIDLPPGCPFASRCIRRQDVCDAERPALKKHGVREAACHFAEMKGVSSF
jgi:oligopeptide/dipeptide ABC transporter ATP-binding protein